MRITTLCDVRSAGPPKWPLRAGSVSEAFTIEGDKIWVHFTDGIQLLLDDVLATPETFHVELQRSYLRERA